MKEKHTKITDLFVLVVFAIFAVCVLIVLLYGANVYRDLVRSSEARFETRTAAQYVTTRVRQARSVTVADFDGCEALVMTEDIDGETYLTRVYCYEGFIRELFCAANAALTPADGERVLPADSLYFSLEKDLLTVTIDDRQIYLDLAVGEGAAP